MGREQTPQWKPLWRCSQRIFYISVGTLAQGLHPAPRSRILQVPLLRQNRDRYGGYFVSRLKGNANPLIVAANRKWRGNSIDVVGKRLRDVLPLLKREVLDVEVEVKHKRRKYRGKQSMVKILSLYKVFVGVGVGIENNQKGTVRIFRKLVSIHLFS